MVFICEMVDEKSFKISFKLLLPLIFNKFEANFKELNNLLLQNHFLD